MQNYMQEHGTSYYVANWFLPKSIRDDVFALYAFVRIPDDIVDDPMADPTITRNQLHRYEKMFNDLYETWVSQGTSFQQREVVIRSTVEVIKRYDIPVQWIKEFFTAMYADLDKKVYYTYEELQQYMHGSAEVIWLMMCKIIWYDKTQEKEVFRTAKLLWEAMQYTNFLRDIVEDSLDFDRLYIPEDRLMQHDLNHTLLIQYITWKKVDDTWMRFMSQQVLFTKELYREANMWIDLLHKKWRFAVRVASWMYESILDKMVKHKYDVFSKSARTSKVEKLRTLFYKSGLHAIGKLD